MLLSTGHFVRSKRLFGLAVHCECLQHIYHAVEKHMNTEWGEGG